MGLRSSAHATDIRFSIKVHAKAIKSSNKVHALCQGDRGRFQLLACVLCFHTRSPRAPLLLLAPSMAGGCENLFWIALENRSLHLTSNYTPPARFQAISTRMEDMHSLVDIPGRLAMPKKKDRVLQTHSPQSLASIATFPRCADAARRRRRARGQSPDARIHQPALVAFLSLPSFCFL